MIEDVVIKALNILLDERGWLLEILRSDWQVFEKFGQAYVTTAYPNIVKAWHMHKKQTDHMICARADIDEHTVKTMEGKL